MDDWKRKSKNSFSSQFLFISVLLLFHQFKFHHISSSGISVCNFGHTTVDKFCEGEGTISSMEHYRADGVRITHDPFAPGMAEKYGMPGKTDQ